jgi:hypothetical protein
MNRAQGLLRIEQFPFTATGIEDANAAWFCVRTQPRHEHIAAAGLRRNLKLEVFLPGVRFKRPAWKGLAWVFQVLFMNYLFARFDLSDSLQRAPSACGVAGLILALCSLKMKDEPNYCRLSNSWFFTNL